MKRSLFIYLFGIIALPFIMQAQKPVNTQINQQMNFHKASTTGFFEENKGQIRDQYGQSRSDVLFSGSTEGMVYHITNKGISYQLTRIDTWQQEAGHLKMPNKTAIESRMVPDGISIYRVDLNWLNANTSPAIQKGKVLPGYTNYYNVPSGVKPVLNVQQYADITFRNVWNGVDLQFYSKDGVLESDWLVGCAEDYQQNCHHVCPLNHSREPLFPQLNAIFK